MTKGRQGCDGDNHIARNRKDTKNYRMKLSFFPALYAAVVSASSFITMVSANMAMFQPVRTRLNFLLTHNDISDDQYVHIVNNFASDEFLDAAMMNHDDQMIEYNHTTRTPLTEEVVNTFILWLNKEVVQDSLSQNTADLIINVFNLYPPDDVPEFKSALSGLNGPAPANYTNNGVVKFFARSDFAPGSEYNGIWGYRTGSREYALQCNIFGLNILDVTTDDIVKVQTIPMPGGKYWRDVATYRHFAYVAAQNKGNAWVIDLSELSNSTAQGKDSDPISGDNIKDFGYTDWGHTLNAWNDLLFLNSARMGDGCKIFDLLDDPMNPREIMHYAIGECHDSYVQTINNADILITSDGYDKKWRLYDITDIRSESFQFSILGETPAINGSAYAHQSVVSTDGSTLFVFEEFNGFDIGVYDISNFTNPELIRQFQWSEDGATSSIVHNGFVRGKYLMVAYYEAGLRIFDISNVTDGITEVGKYETYRDPDGNGVFSNNVRGDYNGTWNVYVGLPSGKVLVSDFDHGTFVVTVEDYLPASSPSTSPTKSPASFLSTSPTKSPTSPPTTSPTSSPTSSPTISPTSPPTSTPTAELTKSPTSTPTTSTSNSPTSSHIGHITEPSTSSPRTNGIESYKSYLFMSIVVFSCLLYLL